MHFVVSVCDWACDGKKADQKKVDEVYDWLELPNLTEELTK